MKTFHALTFRPRILPISVAKTMKNLSKLLMVLWITLAVSSCFTPKSIHKDRSIPKPVDFKQLAAQHFFKRNKIYIVKLTDGREVKLKLQEIKPSGIEGILIRKENARWRKDPTQIDIAFERMADAKMYKFNPALTAGSILVPSIVGAIIAINNISFDGLFE